MTKKFANSSFITTALAIFCLTACSEYDSKYIPYKLTCFNVYLYDEKKAPDADYFAGSIQCTYKGRKEGLSRARSLAYHEAKSMEFDISNGRYYIICTSTKNSGCITKVR